MTNFDHIKLTLIINGEVMKFTNFYPNMPCGAFWGHQLFHSHTDKTSNQDNVMCNYSVFVYADKGDTIISRIIVNSSPMFDNNKYCGSSKQFVWHRYYDSTLHTLGHLVPNGNWSLES